MLCTDVLHEGSGRGTMVVAPACRSRLDNTELKRATGASAPITRAAAPGRSMKRPRSMNEAPRAVWRGVAQRGVSGSAGMLRERSRIIVIAIIR